MSNFYIFPKGKWDFIVCLLIVGVNEKTPSEQAIEGTANAAERQPQFYRGVSAASERRLSAAREDRAEPEWIEFTNTKNEIQFPFWENIKINHGRRNCLPHVRTSAERQVRNEQI